MTGHDGPMPVPFSGARSRSRSCCCPWPHWPPPSSHSRIWIVDRVASTRQVTHDIQATVKVLGGTVVHGFWIALLASAAGWAAGPRAALLTALTLPLLGIAGVFALEREGAAWSTARTWLALRRTSPATRRQLRRAEQAMAMLLDDAHAWVSARERSPSSAPGPSPDATG